MKSLRDILWFGSVLVLFTGSDSILHAERGPSQEISPLPALSKKTFDDLLNDPSAILDMDEEELTDLLPPIEKAQLPSLAEPQAEPPPSKAEAPRAPTQAGTNGSLLASPFSMVAIPTPPPPGMEPKPEAVKEEKTPLTMEASLGLPLVLSPSFFATVPGRNVAGARQPIPDGKAMPPLPGVVDVSIILMHNQFYPSSIKLKEGVQTRLIFTTTNKRPAALVIERLQIQRWIAKEDEQKPSSENDRIRWEVSRELNSSRVTEVVIDPHEGVYSFHDAMSGAAGEITVE